MPRKIIKLREREREKGPEQVNLGQKMKKGVVPYLT